jgi:hypothetical protein
MGPGMQRCVSFRKARSLEFPFSPRHATLCVWLQAYANLGSNTETSRKLLLLLAEEACARQETYRSLPAVAWALTVAGCLPDPLLRKVT